jgi:hypothetical protein
MTTYKNVKRKEVMKSFALKASMLGILGGMALVSGSAMAHVGYGSALYQGAGTYDPLTGTTAASSAYGAAANFTATASSNGGYLAGLNPDTLGNTHDIRFRYFILNSDSLVSFTINGLSNSNGASTLNPGFSLYKGVVPGASHDGVGDVASVATDPDTAAYLATAKDFASWSPFAGTNSVRGGAAAGTPGNPTGLWGVFDTNGNITTGNNGTTGATDTHGPNYLGGLDTPKVATIVYTGISGADAATGSTFTNSSGGTTAILGADGLVDNKVSWSGQLAAGIYTLAIGGANGADYAQLYSDIFAGGATTGSPFAAAYAADRLARNLSITGFQVTAVPLPGAAWMFVSAMLGFLGLNRRKSQA